MRTSRLSRRRALGTLAASLLAVPAGRLFSGTLQTTPTTPQTPPPKPATNIADALKHPRTAASLPGRFPGKVVRAVDARAWTSNEPDVEVVNRMLERSLLALTGAAGINEAWSMFVTPDDMIGLKVNPVAGKLLSTSPQLVHAIIRQLTAAGIPRDRIVIWDRREFEMHEVGFTAETFPGIRITGTERKDAQGSFHDKEGKLHSEKVIDRDWYYWADVEGEYDDEHPSVHGERGEVLLLHIDLHERGHQDHQPADPQERGLVGDALPEESGVRGDLEYRAPAQAALGRDLCGGAGIPAAARQGGAEHRRRHQRLLPGRTRGADPQYITNFNTLLVGTDPVAVDRVGYEIILKKRIEEKIQKEENPKGRLFLELAEKLGLGVADPSKIERAEV